MTLRFKAVGLWGFAAALTVALIVGVGVALSAALTTYSQAEQRYDAENRVATHIVIRRAKQHARITRAPIEATQVDAAPSVGNGLRLVQYVQDVNRLRSPAR